MLKKLYPTERIKILDEGTIFSMLDYQNIIYIMLKSEPHI